MVAVMVKTNSLPITHSLHLLTLILLLLHLLLGLVELFSNLQRDIGRHGLVDHSCGSRRRLWKARLFCTLFLYPAEVKKYDKL